MSAHKVSEPRSPYLFHHCRALEHVRYGLVTQHRALATPLCSSPNAADCPHWDDTSLWDLAYGWLEAEFGFWPLFCSVGSHANALADTGYSGQWCRVTSWAKAANTYRQPGQYPSDVLFSFASLPAPVRYSDIGWFTASLLNAVEWGNGRHYLRAIAARERACVLKPSWPASRWLREAKADRICVQACVPGLDLRTADSVWCRSASARAELIAMGFDSTRVFVVRLPVRSLWA